eukprot:4539749-Alexandrium_andersonii.AAC.1
MSASLVGSEMCIRDSFRSDHGSDPPPPLDSSGGARATRRESRRARGTAVSYTHLTLPTICSV